MTETTLPTYPEFNAEWVEDLQYPGKPEDKKQSGYYASAFDPDKGESMWCFVPVSDRLRGDPQTPGQVRDMISEALAELRTSHGVT